MSKNIFSTCLGTLLAVAVSGVTYAAPGMPNFSPAVYGDGQLWGTKFTTVVPEAKETNRQSFDALYVILNASLGAAQMPVSEAAPGNPSYNGGRWFVHTVLWTEAGFAAHGGSVPLLTSYDDIMYHQGMGHLAVTPGSFTDGPPTYFQCPLLPVK